VFPRTGIDAAENSWPLLGNVLAVQLVAIPTGPIPAADALEVKYGLATMCDWRGSGG
jgi:hypothetical protein